MDYGCEIINKTGIYFFLSLMALGLISVSIYMLSFLLVFLDSWELELNLEFSFQCQCEYVSVFFCTKDIYTFRKPIITITSNNKVFY